MPDVACDPLLTLFGMLGTKGKHEVRFEEPGQRPIVRRIDCTDQTGLVSSWEVYGRHGACYTTAMPSGGLTGALWAVLETGDNRKRLRAFTPRPTLVLQEGDTNHAVALWALAHPLEREPAMRANKRLAHALGAKKKHCDPWDFTLRTPDSLVPTKRGEKRVRVLWCQPSLYAPLQVIGRLRDAPDPEKWRERNVA